MTASDVFLASAVSGAPGAPWLVLSNSLGATMAMWQPQLALLERHYRVLRYDGRGHGASATPPAPYGFDDLVADLMAVMDAHGVERATIIGLSLGGMTALGAGFDHPGRIERVVCCAARADAPQPFVQSWEERIAVLAGSGVAALWPATLQRWLTPHRQQQAPDLVATLKADFERTTAEGYRGCAQALKTLNYLNRLGGLTVPACFIAGAEDVGAPPTVMQQMAEATPYGRFAVIPEAAHIVNADNPDAFNAALMAFLAPAP